MESNAFAIEEEVVEFFLSKLEIGSTILEFGSGVGTLKLLENFNVISVEDNPKWVGYATKLNKSDYNSNYLHAPLVEIEPVEGLGHSIWYDRSLLSPLMEMDFDAVLIDGPLGKYGRGGIIGFISDNLEIFSNKLMVIDDCDRLDELKIFLRTHELIGGKADIFEGKKRFGVISP